MNFALMRARPSATPRASIDGQDARCGQVAAFADPPGRSGCLASPASIGTIIADFEWGPARKGATWAGNVPGMKRAGVSAVVVVIVIAVSVPARWVFTGDSRTVQAVTNLAQIISVIALPIALYAIWSAKRDLVKERRVGHELEILRDLTVLTPEKGRGGEIDELTTCGTIRALVLAIPDRDDLPLTRAALFAAASDAARNEFERLCRDAPSDDTPWGRTNRFVALLEHDRATFRSEIQAAINKRVDPKS